MLDRWAAIVHRRARVIVVLAVLAVAAAGSIGLGVAERLDPYGAEDPASESARADRLLERATGEDADAGVVLLVDLDAAPESFAARARIADVALAVRREPAVTDVVTPAEGAPLSRDGRTALIAVALRPAGDKVQQDTAERIAEGFADDPGVAVGGSALANAEINEQVSADIERAELFALPLILLLSLLFFRGLVAAALPPLVGGMAIVLTFAALRGASELGSISVFALNLVTGLGLGLAIDYALFIVSRYREELAARGPGPEALRATLATAGRTVLYSGLTVAAALASLLVFPQRFLYSMGIGGMLVALLAVTVALVVLPAVLALLGPRVNALSPRRLQRAAAREARADANGRWARLARWVMRRPGRVALVTTLLLVTVGLPFAGIQFGQADAEVLPRDAAARQVSDVVRADFAGGVEEPVQLAVRAAPGPEAERIARAARGVDGVATVSASRPAGPGLTQLTAIIPADPQSDAATRTVQELRALDAGPETLVTGGAARFADLQDSLAGHLPIAAAIIVGGTVLLLFLMTGSVVLPVKALVLNVLTLSATFGVLVLVFQDGRLEGLLDFTSQGAIEITQPVLLFAVVFGLSTDYGVFLLARIKEARDRGAGDREAVAIGLERTGRIVTAAALLFAVAIGAFVTSEIIFIKQLGFGTAIAVLIDATIVRALLVPSLMALLGRRNWWAPLPLRRLHARVGLREATQP